MYVLQEMPIESAKPKLGPGLLAVLANASLVALLAMGIGVAPKISNSQIESSDVFFVPNKPKEAPPADTTQISQQVVPVPIPVPPPVDPPILDVEKPVAPTIHPSAVDAGGARSGSVVEPEISQARILRHVEPPYPIASIRAHEEGTVMLQVFVGVNGRVSDVRVLTSSGFTRLDEAAAKEVRTWRFAPATRGGQPIATWVNVPVKFELR